MSAHTYFQRKATSLAETFPPAAAVVAPTVHEVLASPGHPLHAGARADLETRLGHDFSRVRVHTDTTAAASARAVDALAYTIGRDVVFAAGRYEPGTAEGRRLLTHELTHVVQQGSEATDPRSKFDLSDPDDIQERQAAAVSSEVETTTLPAISSGAQRGILHRQHRVPGPVSVRSPVAEEAVTQLSDVAGSLTGRALTGAEITLARGVFGTSIDFARVRLNPTDVLQYRTVGNNVRVPRDFTIDDQLMAEILIHELTHVWQYQHGGTRYLSDSIQTQIGAGIRGNRSFAYAYELTPRSSFFDFTPEQQAMIVQNYFAMGRDQETIARASASEGTYSSNHQAPGGFPARLTAPQRSAEIGRELPLHQRAIGQLRAALPDAEATILLQRASDVMRIPGPDTLGDQARHRPLIPAKPLLEIRF